MRRQEGFVFLAHVGKIVEHAAENAHPVVNVDEVQRGHNQKAMPTGRDVAKMNKPSCRRSSLSRVACDLSLW